MRRNQRKKYVVCIANEDYPVSLELRKIYERVPDARGEELGFIRIAADEDNDSALFPAEYFVAIDLPKDVEAAIESATVLEAQHR